MENKNDFLKVKSKKNFLRTYLGTDKWMYYWFIIGLCSCINNSKNSSENNPNSNESKIIKPIQINKNTNCLEAKIGNQIWMAYNIDAERFNNGDIIPIVKSIEEWKKAGLNKKPAMCYYNNDVENKTKFGIIYNWYALNDKRGIAPKGWRVATLKDWEILTSYLGESNIAGKKLKSQNGWPDCIDVSSIKGTYPNTTSEIKSGNGTDDFLFNALPSPGRGYHDFDSTETAYHWVEWWTSTENKANKETAYMFGVNCYGNALVDKTTWKEFGLYVRCIKCP
jgi:uncharacterized protein (TIGR02145 family)